jgi:hypothetical protein
MEEKNLSRYAPNYLYLRLHQSHKLGGDLYHFDILVLIN